MKMRPTYLLLLIFIGFGGFLFAESDTAGDSLHGRPMNEILDEIRINQGIEEGDRIDPDRVSEDLLEELGEAYMAVMVPDPKQHRWMDEMMGSEGSERLASMHKYMGHTYLQGGMMGPMGGMMMGPMARGMMSNNVSSGGMGIGMMNWGMSNYWGIVPWVMSGVLAIAVVVLSVLLARKREDK
jgi:hypothetical protein